MLAVLALVLAYGFVRFFEMPYVAMRIEEIVGHDDAARWTALGIMLSTAASGALIYRLSEVPATADWGVRGTFLGAAALSLLFVPACWAIVRGAADRAAPPPAAQGRGR